MANKTQNALSKENFGKNLRNERTNRNFTYEQLAELIEVSSRLIYDYEAGLKFPSIQTLCKIANALGVSLDSMLR